MDIEITVDSDVLDKPPQERMETEEGGSITWNLLCHTGGIMPIKETQNGVTTFIESSFTLKDITTIRDRFLMHDLGVKPSGYIGHANRTSATPSIGTVEDLAIVAPTDTMPFYSLYFKCLWTPEGRKDINTGRYKYVSIEADYDEKGWLMTGFALTNEPACRPMKEIHASSIQKEGINTDIENNGGYHMDQKELDVLFKVLDPKLVVQALLQTPEGKESIAEVIKENMEMFSTDDGDVEDETITAEAAESDEKRKVDEGAGFREYDRKNEDVNKKESAEDRHEDEGTGFRDYDKEKKAEASSLVVKAEELFNATVKDLKAAGFDLKKVTTSKIAQARKQAVASAIDGTPLDESVRAAIKELKIMNEISPIKGTKVAIASSVNDNISDSPIAGALRNINR